MSENARGRGHRGGYRRNNRGKIRSEQRTELPEEAVQEAEQLPAEEALPAEVLPFEEELQEDPLPEEAATAEEAAEQTLPYEVEVIGVRFRTSGKIYYFDPCGKPYPVGSHAIVETARGIEYGEVASTNRVVKGSEVVAPLRAAIRIATPQDDAHYEENRKKEQEAFEICISKINAHGLEMKLIDAEYTFDNTKLLFYFTADGRVDFRDLVKNLASVFRCRIELRQLGIRDEAKALGGIGICGRPYCCHSFLPDFVQVSIKMAKEQNLSLNAAKISGACGRLMCCLRYEYETYLEEGRRTPKEGSIVHNAEGDFKVLEAKLLTGMLKVRPANDPEGEIRILNREEVEMGPGPERPAPVKPAPRLTPQLQPQPEKEAPRAQRNERQDKSRNARQKGQPLPAVADRQKNNRPKMKPATPPPPPPQKEEEQSPVQEPQKERRSGRPRGHRGGRKNHGRPKKTENSGE